MKKASGFKEFIRKRLVGLKRRPQVIPMLALIAAFLVYSLNLTDVSDTTAKIQGAGMGLCGFCTMLFSILSFVCFLNAYPHRKKTNIPMLVLMLGMIGLVIFCDVKYLACITAALTRADNPISISKNTLYIAYANNMLNTHIVLLCIAVGLILLLPVYAKLLRRINTSVSVEDNGRLGEIEISGEDQ